MVKLRFPKMLTLISDLICCRFQKLQNFFVNEKIIFLIFKIRILKTSLLKAVFVKHIPRNPTPLTLIKFKSPLTLFS